jgi:hypothetical protein
MFFCEIETKYMIIIKLSLFFTRFKRFRLSPFKFKSLFHLWFELHFQINNFNKFVSYTEFVNELNTCEIYLTCPFETFMSFVKEIFLGKLKQQQAVYANCTCRNEFVGRKM